MFQIRIFLLIMALNFNSVNSCSLSVPSSNKEINRLTQASIYYSSSNFEKSFLTARLVMRQAIKIKNDNLIVKCYQVITTNFEELSKFDKAIFFYNKGLSYGNIIDNGSIKYEINNNLGNIYCFEKKKYKKAASSFLKGIKLVKEGKEKFDLFNTHQEYSKYFFKNGNDKNAYENLANYNKITIDLLNKKIDDKVEISGTNLEFDEYKREIKKIGIEKELQSQSIKKSKIIVLLFISVVSVLLLLIYTLIKNNNFKKKINTELSYANDKLILAKNKAEEASILKSQFVSTITHELRTPLYGVIGITNMLLDEHKELAESPHLKSLKFSARYLLSLVNDVLQINKIEENRVILENLTFNISDELNMIKNSLLFLAKNNHNTMILKIGSKIPENLIGDKLRLSQILINLIGNALKFTTNGEVLIEVNLLKITNKFHFIEFKIKDNGVGIAIEDQDKIFEKFVQVGRKADDYQGTGLGLTIVKSLLKLFGSAISIESTVGIGTEFNFTIAFESDTNKTNEIIKNIQVDLSLNKLLKVLVVEDNKINQIVTEKILKKNNYTCTIVDDGFQALKVLEEEDFDIIFMDINMPLMNGFETSKRIRNLGIKTPIVALTAFDKEEIIEEAISAGINDIIVKPFDSNTLFKCIDNLGSKNLKKVLF